MGWNIGLKDKLGTLSHNAGVLTLTPSLLTIGGRQYKTTSNIIRTISADVTMGQNVLYIVFAIVSGGTVQLRVSANMNSTGPSGFSAWQIVGAFYSDCRNVFGSFVNIEGAPATQTYIEEGFGLGGGLTGLFNGFPSFSLTNYQWTRDGQWLSVNVRMDSVQSNGVSARIPLPRGGISSAEVNKNLGTYAGQNGSSNASGGSIVSLSSTDVGFAGPNLTGAAISLQSSTTVVGTQPTTLVAAFRTKISQWSAKPLVDL